MTTWTDSATTNPGDLHLRPVETGGGTWFCPRGTGELGVNVGGYFESLATGHHCGGPGSAVEVSDASSEVEILVVGRGGPCLITNLLTEAFGSGYHWVPVLRAIYRFTNTNAIGVAIATGGSTFSANDKARIVREGNDIVGYIDTGGGFVEDLRATDTTFMTNVPGMRSGASIAGAGQWDNFIGIATPGGPTGSPIHYYRRMNA